MICLRTNAMSKFSNLLGAFSRTLLQCGAIQERQNATNPDGKEDGVFFMFLFVVCRMRSVTASASFRKTSRSRRVSLPVASGIRLSQVQKSRCTYEQDEFEYPPRLGRASTEQVEVYWTINKHTSGTSVLTRNWLAPCHYTLQAD